MTQMYYETLPEALEVLQEKVIDGCICTLTEGEEMEYGSNRSFKSAKPGYILSVVYKDGEQALLDNPEWNGWTVGKPSYVVCAERGKLTWPYGRYSFYPLEN